MTFSDDHLRGWCAAERGEPFEATETAAWQEGFQLFHSTQESKRAWAAEDLSVACH